jgi:hypothetical protein
MKAELYNALAALNRGAELQIESLAIIQAEGALAADYVEHQRHIVEETRAGINFHIHGALESREAKDWHHFEQLRLQAEPETELPEND